MRCSSAQASPPRAARRSAERVSGRCHLPPARGASGLSHPARPLFLTRPRFAAPAGQVHCLMCLSDVDAAVASEDACGHSFCDDCWRGLLSTRVRDGMSKRILCPEVGCGATVRSRAAEPAAWTLLTPGPAD